MLRPLAHAALALLALAGSAAASGRVVYVAAPEVKDPALARLLLELEPDPARRLVLQLGGEPAPDVDHRLEVEDPRVDDAALARAVDDAALLELRGGSFMQWFDTLYPTTGRTRLARALHDFALSERTIVVRGGAAAFLSGGALVPVDELRERERNPRRTAPHRPRVANGLGPRALFDADEWSGGSPLRLLRALRDTHVDLGVHFIGQVAVELQRDPARLEVHGPGAVLLLDLARARRPRERVEEGRLSLLREGDVWDFGDERVVPAATRPGRGPSDPLRAREEADPVRGPHLVQALFRQQREPSSRQRLDEGAPGPDRARWELGWDADSRRVDPERSGGAPAPALPALLRVPFRCAWGAALDGD
jgi:hypothetical protein